MEERLTEIEIKLAHLEQAMNELNEVMVQHSDLIDRLNSQNTKLREQLDMLGSGESNPDPDHEKPPHY
jgi:SlyX protein